MAEQEDRSQNETTPEPEKRRMTLTQESDQKYTEAMVTAVLTFGEDGVLSDRTLSPNAVLERTKFRLAEDSNRDQSPQPKVASGSSSQREIGIQFADGDPNDPIVKALRQARDIPVEQYMSQERAQKVHEAQDRRTKPKPVHAESVDKSVFANSSFDKTGVDDLAELVGRKYRRDLYRSVSHFEAHDRFLVRTFECMTKKERHGQEGLMKAKREKRNRRAKKRDEGQDAGSDEEISSFSEQIPRVQPVFPRNEHYGNRVPKPGHLSLEPHHLEGQQRKNYYSMQQRSLLPIKDARSVALSGMLVQKNVKMQTLTQYDLVPEVIYNAMEMKMQELLKEIIGPTITRQQVLETQNNQLFSMCHKFDGKLRDCWLGIKKQMNIREEIEKLVIRLDNVDVYNRRLDSGLSNLENRTEGKVENISAQLRIIKGDIKSMTKIMERKNADSNKMQEICNSFKDRLMEKYQILADEYIGQFKQVERRHMELQEEIAQMVVDNEKLQMNHSELKIEQIKDIKALEDTNEDIEALKRCYKFELRISALEGKAKSDLFDVQRTCQQVLDQDKYNLKRAEAVKLVYSVQVDAAQTVMGIEKQTQKIAGKKTTADMFDSYTQATLNMLEWQMAFSDRDPFDKDKSAEVIEALAKKVKTNARKLRTEHLIVQLNARRLGQMKPKRANSMLQSLLKIEEIPKLEMPEVKKKVVVFAAENNIMGPLSPSRGSKSKTSLASKESKVSIELKVPGSPTSMASNASPSSPGPNSLGSNPALQSQEDIRLATLKKKPTKANLRKFTKLLEPHKRREIAMLSKMKRSNSFVWEPLEKATIENLWSDPNKSTMLSKLKSGLTSMMNSPRGVAGASQSPKPQINMEARQPRTFGYVSPQVDGERFIPKTRALGLEKFGERVAARMAPRASKIQRQETITGATQQQPIVSALQMPLKQPPSWEQSHEALPEPSGEQLRPNASNQAQERPERKQGKRGGNRKASMRVQQLKPVSKIQSQLPSAPHEQPVPQMIDSSQTSQQARETSSTFAEIAGTTTASQMQMSQTTESNMAATDQRRSSMLETVDEEMKTIQSRHHLQQQVDEKIERINNSRGGAAFQSPSALDATSEQQSNATAPVMRRKDTVAGIKVLHDSQTSESDALFSESEDVRFRIDPSMYNEFVTHDNLADELEQFREDLRLQILEEARARILTETDEMIEGRVGEAQYSMTVMLEEQLGESQQQIKVILAKEMEASKRMTEHIKTTLLPENIKKVKTMLQDGIDEQKQALEDINKYCSDSIKKFAQRVEYFEIEVTSAMTKFKRLLADQDLFKTRVSQNSKRTREMVKVMRSEQLAVSKLVSTLVELEFIQQSLDFQDEFDKTQMHLYGLNDLNMTLDDFISKSTEIAQRKLHHEALQQASDLELEQLGEQNHKKGYFEMTDSHTYQAIEMGDNWPEHLTDDHLRKQIHQAFKMACVYYKPSPVLYRGHKYNRRALIEAKRGMLDAEWQLMLKFQPFKRLWGEDSNVDFFEQFATKLNTFILNKKMGADVAQIMEDAAEDTFVKILSGTNIFDMKLKGENGSGEDDLMSSDFELPNEIRMASALYNNQSPHRVQPLNISTINMGMDPTQSSIKLLPGEQNAARETSRLKQEKNRHLEMISNRKDRISPREEEFVSNTIDTRTRSMLNAMQGRSIFQTQEESLFSTEDMGKTNTSKNLTSRSKQLDSKKRLQARSVQQKIDSAQGAGIFTDSNFLNQSAVIYEQGPDTYRGDEKGKGRKSSKKLTDNGTPFGNATVHKPNSRNKQALDKQQHYSTMYSSQRAVGIAKDFSKDNPLVEMRPLMGKEQLRQTRQGFLPDHENFGMNALDIRSIGKNIGALGRTQFATNSPWNRQNQPMRTSYGEKVGRINAINQPLDMTVIGKKDKTSNSRQLLEKNMPQAPKISQSKNAGSQIIQPPFSYPISIPVQTSHNSSMMMNSPVTNGIRQAGRNQYTEEPKPRNSLSHAVLTLPQVGVPGKKHVGRNITADLTEVETERKLAGTQVSVTPMQSQLELAVTPVNKSSNSKCSVNQQAAQFPTMSGGAQGGKNSMTGKAPEGSIDGVASATSLWGPDDDMGNKMQAKLGENSTSLNTRKLKDIARQKKQQQQMAQQINYSQSNKSASHLSQQTNN